MSYAMAPFILRRKLPLLVAFAAASHTLRMLSYHSGFYGDGTDYRFFPFELSLFLYGSICFRLGQPVSMDIRLSATVTAFLVLMLVFLPRYFLEHQYQLYLCVGLLLPVLFDFSRKTRWDRLLGELSYPLYLVHWPIIFFLAVLTTTIQPGAFGTAWVYPWLAVATSIAAAILATGTL